MIYNGYIQNVTTILVITIILLLHKNCNKIMLMLNLDMQEWQHRRSNGATLNLANTFTNEYLL